MISKLLVKLIRYNMRTISFSFGIPTAMNKVEGVCLHFSRQSIPHSIEIVYSKYRSIRRPIPINHDIKIYHVHMVSWDFTVEPGYTLKQWLKDNRIPCEQRGRNFFALGADGQRTGEVYSIVNDIPTDDVRTS